MHKVVKQCSKGFNKVFQRLIHHPRNILMILSKSRETVKWTITQSSDKFLAVDGTWELITAIKVLLAEAIQP